MASIAASGTLVWAPDGHHEGAQLHPAYLLHSDGETAEIEWAANGTTANIPCCCISELPPRRCCRQLQGGNNNDDMLAHGSMNEIVAEIDDGKVHGIQQILFGEHKHKKHSKVQVIIKEDVKNEETYDENGVHQFGNAHRGDVNTKDHNKMGRKEKVYDSLERAPLLLHVQLGGVVTPDHNKKGHREIVYDSLERATLPSNNREKVYDSLERAPPSCCIISKALTKKNQEYETKEQIIDEFIAQRCKVGISKSQKIDELIARRMAQSPPTPSDDTGTCSPKKRKFTALIDYTPECNSIPSAVKLRRKQDCASSAAGIGAPSERSSRGVFNVPGSVCSGTTTLNNADVQSNNLIVSHNEKGHNSGAPSERRCKAKYDQSNCNGYCLTSCFSRNGDTQADVVKGHVALKSWCNAEEISIDQQNIAKTAKSPMFSIKSEGLAALESSVIDIVSKTSSYGNAAKASPKGFASSFTSHLKGPSYHIRKNSYESKLRREGCSIYLGLYRLASDAALARDLALKMLYGDSKYHLLNFGTTKAHLDMQEKEMKLTGMKSETIEDVTTKVRRYVSKISSPAEMGTKHPPPKGAHPERRCKAEGCVRYKASKCDGHCLTCFRECNGNGDEQHKNEPPLDNSSAQSKQQSLERISHHQLLLPSKKKRNIRVDEAAQRREKIINSIQHRQSLLAFINHSRVAAEQKESDSLSSSGPREGGEDINSSKEAKELQISSEVSQFQRETKLAEKAQLPCRTRGVVVDCSGFRLNVEERKTIVKKSFGERITDLKEHLRVHGHIKVTKKTDPALARWCNHVRFARRHPDHLNSMKLTENHISALDSLEFGWNPDSKQKRNMSCEERILELSMYHETYGSPTWKSYPRLAQFCADIRYSVKHPEKPRVALSEDNIADLDSFGFEWNPANFASSSTEITKVVIKRIACGNCDGCKKKSCKECDACTGIPKKRCLQRVCLSKIWVDKEEYEAAKASGDKARLKETKAVKRGCSSRIEELKSYLETHGKAPTHLTNKSLAIFCCNLRHSRRHPEKSKMKLSDGDIAELDALGFEWNPKTNGKTFLDRVDELRIFKANHGHFNVTHTQNRSLAKFCSNVRNARNNLDSKLKLSDDDIAELDELGFDWHPKKIGKTFSERLDELRAFKAQHGHLFVSQKQSSSQKRNISLERFCAKVRHARHDPMSKLKLSGDDIAELDALGFEWNPKTNGKTFLDRVDELRTFKANHGHFNVTHTQNRSLAKFCSNVRNARNNLDSKLKLSDDDIAELDELGFDWDPNKSVCFVSGVMR